VWVRVRRIVRSRKEWPENSFRYFPSGSSSETFPCSARRRIAGVVATTLVSDATSKIVSSVMSSWRGTRLREPKAFR